MFVVDTNILFYAADRTAAGHRQCRSFLDTCRRQPGPWFLTWGIVYEFLRVATHPRVQSQPWTTAQAWIFVDALLTSPSARLLVPGPHHAQVLQQMIEGHPDCAGNMMFDLRTAALMLEHGVDTIVTRDRHFHRFAFLTVQDPLAVEPTGRSV